MLLINQDMSVIINFDKAIFIDVFKTHIRVIMENITFFAGEYKSEERAKEVLGEIIYKYEEDSFYKKIPCGEGVYSVKELNHPQPKVYILPKE